ncbi:MAG TPA: hypothetical protein VHW01_14430 [Polyangiaceae bacterium]|nr:hypothetical protein [Polyangiaceae bacterium]
MQRDTRIDDLEVDALDNELSAEELRTIWGGICGTAGTYDNKVGECVPDTVCY